MVVAVGVVVMVGAYVLLTGAMRTSQQRREHDEREGTSV